MTKILGFTNQAAVGLRACDLPATVTCGLQCVRDALERKQGAIALPYEDAVGSLNGQ